MNVPCIASKSAVATVISAHIWLMSRKKSKTWSTEAADTIGIVLLVPDLFFTVQGVLVSGTHNFDRRHGIFDLSSLDSNSTHFNGYKSAYSNALGTSCSYLHILKVESS